MEEIKTHLKDLDVKYETELNKHNQDEAEEFLFKHKTKADEITGENERFIRRDKIRQKKQALYVWYHEQKEKMTELLDTNLKKLEKAQEQRKNLRKLLKKAKRELINVYCRILKDGQDIRSEGLRWAIKALWAINEPVPVSAFPKFLDDDSAQFLLNMAQKDIELNEFQARLDKLKEVIKSKHLNSSFTKTSKEIFDNVKLRIKKISTSRVGKTTTLNKSMKINEKEEDSFELDGFSTQSEIT